MGKGLHGAKNDALERKRTAYKHDNVYKTPAQRELEHLKDEREQVLVPFWLWLIW